MTSSFLSDFEAFYDLAVKDLALQMGVGEKLKVANATHTTRFGVRLSWQSALCSDNWERKKCSQSGL